MMMILVVLMAILAIGSGVGNVGGYTANPNHNGEKHDLLCVFLGAAVQKWKTTNHPDVRKALAQAIFGSTQGGQNLENFMLHPHFYKDGSRESRCGKCLGTPDHYPGKSIPHDLLCLCTVGHNGYPFNSDVTINKLCGQTPSDLGCQEEQGSNKCSFSDGEKGWGRDGNGINHLEKTWENIVRRCLQRGSSASIEEELRDLARRVEGNEYTKWEGDGHQNCGGDGHTNICVKYHGCGRRHHDTIYPQWWEQLPWALRTPNLTEDQLNSTAFFNSTIGAADSAQTSRQGSSRQAMPYATSASSTTEAPPGTMLPLLSKQESGTPLTPPHSWFLTANILI